MSITQYHYFQILSNLFYPKNQLSNIFHNQISYTLEVA